ncbi:MAG: hypothetical protein IJE19_10220 [Clostridia bacterium]|nr:hypothetical protein [Clostridia bacterium]
MKIRVIRFLENAVGVVALVLLVCFFFISGIETRQTIAEYTVPTTAGNSGFFVFDDEEFVFDGTTRLDLMQGVYADNGRGDDATESVNAVITSKGTLSRKEVRYSFFDSQGKTITETRTLIMKNYSGPRIEAADTIMLTSQELDDIISVLQERGELSATDGFGMDITSTVSCIRKHIYQDKYEMRFEVYNNYQDYAEVTVTAYIEGDVIDPVIELWSDSVTLKVGDPFDPMDAVSNYGVGSSGTGKLEYDSSVNTAAAGTYNVVFRLYSQDGTAEATKVLNVIVK